MTYQQTSASNSLTEENFYTDCADPVSRYLQQARDSWVDERTIVIPVTLNEKEFTGKLILLVSFLEF